MNIGEMNKRISIVTQGTGKDSDGFPNGGDTDILTCWARVITTKGYTLIQNKSDFEKAYTNFTIRYNPDVDIERGQYIIYGSKRYFIEYVNNINEDNQYIELQASEVRK